MLDQKAQDKFYSKEWRSNIHLFKHSGKNLINEINNLNPTLVIDAGCGINFFKGKIQNLVGYDPVFKEADILCTHETAPFKEQCADVILALGSINWGNRQDVGSLLLKMKSFLKPGGRLYMSGAPDGYDNDSGLKWFIWNARDIHYFAELLDFELLHIKVEYNPTGTLETRRMPHRYVWCYRRKNG